MNQSEFDIGIIKLLDKDFTEWVKTECIWVKDEEGFYAHIKTENWANTPFDLYEVFMRVTKPFPTEQDYMDWVDARKEANKKRFLALVSPRPSTWKADYKRRKRKRFWNKIVLRYLIAKDYIKNLLNIKDND